MFSVGSYGGSPAESGQNRYQQMGNAIQAPQQDWKSAMAQPNPSMAAPGMPQVARQQTSGPQAPPQPFTRQNMPQQSQMQRRNVPNVS